LLRSPERQLQLANLAVQTAIAQAAVPVDTTADKLFAEPEWQQWPNAPLLHGYLGWEAWWQTANA
jgi:hypothetical protein